MIVIPTLSPELAIDALDALGSVGRIVDHLVENEHRGQPRADCCPLTDYLRERTSAHEVLVSSHAWRVKTPAGLRAGLLPERLHDFVRGFDAGCFPELCS